MKKVRGRRALLNPPGYQSTAAIVAEVEDTRGWAEGVGTHGETLNAGSGNWAIEPDYKFDISDCSRVISLAIDWETAGDRKAAIYKLDQMIEALAVFREAVIEEQKLYVWRQRLIKRLKKEKEATTKPA